MRWFYVALGAALFVALGLVAAGLHWWTTLPALAAFALVTWLAHAIASSLRERIRDAR